MYFIGHLPKRTLLLITALLLVVGAFFVIPHTPLGQSLASTSIPLSSDDDTGRADFLASYGWEITAVPEEVVEVTIPGSFNQVYERYNDLQLSQGFDLTPYRGKTVKRYTYTVHNYPDYTGAVHANVLIYKGSVIGGDICTYDLDGFMHGFSADETGVIHQTLSVMP